MHPVDYCRRINFGQDRPQERAIMARVALNALLDPHEYPLDLSELTKLSSEPYVLSRSMLTYCALHPECFGNIKAEDATQLRATLEACIVISQDKSRSRVEVAR